MPKINIKENSAEIKKEAKKKMIGYITTALSLVAGLAWNEAIKGIIEYLFPIEQNTILAKLIYAVAITIILAVITVFLTEAFLKEEKAGSIAE